MLPSLGLCATRINESIVTSTADTTEIVLQSAVPIRFDLNVLRRPDRLVLELEDVEPGEALESLIRTLNSGNPHVRRSSIEVVRNRIVRVKLELQRQVDPRVYVIGSEGDKVHSLVLEIGATAALDERQHEAWIAVAINGQNLPDPALVLQRNRNRIFVRGEDLQRWRLRLPDAKPVSHLGESYFSLDSLSGLRYRLDDANQRLHVDAPAALFERTEFSASAVAHEAAIPPSLGGFLNYDLYANYAPSGMQPSALFEAGAFSPWGSGVSRLLTRDLAGRDTVVRLESTWTRDQPGKTASLRVGDAITSSSSSWGGAVRFGGIQWATNFDTRPDLIAFPSPNLEGEARLPSTLDLYIDGALRLRREIQPGPFSIQDIPIMTGQGETRLVVRDLLGREQVISRPYYASSQLLRSGLHDYSYEIGRVRENFGIASNDYGRLLAVATHRFGLTDWFTPEIHGELLRDQQTLGLAGTFLWPTIGTLTVAAAGSHAQGGNGALVSLGIEHRGRRWGLGINGQVASEYFTHLGRSPEGSAPRHTGQAFANVALGRLGSIGLGYTHQGYGNSSAVELATASYNIGLANLGFFSLAASRVVSAEVGAPTSLSDTSISAFFTRPFGKRSTASTYWTQQGQDHQSGVQIQRNLPAGPGWGYRMAAGAGNSERGEAGLSWQHRYGKVMLDAAGRDRETLYRASASGGIGMIGGDVFFGPRIEDSFAVVSVPGFAGVRVYRENQEVGRTNAHGNLMLAGLRSYQKNGIRIEQADLPLDSEISELQTQAATYFRSGLLVEVPVKLVRGALMSIVLENDEALPAGSVVELLGSGQSFPVGLRGEVYLTGLSVSNKLRATWGQRSCEIEFLYPQTNDPLPHLGVRTCRRERRP